MVLDALDRRATSTWAPFTDASGVLSFVAETPIGARGLRGTAVQVRATLAMNPTWRATWAPPRRTLLEVADGWVRGAEFRQSTGKGGAGVVVGIIDTGIDPAHGDFRTRDGRSRVAWLIDFSRPPAGFHPSLEEAYGCSNESGRTCAVYSAANLDELIANSTQNDEPRDVFGHGTHVASLATSNGLSQFSRPKYVGVAPEATLVVARVTRTAANQILDGDILDATTFVFERAAVLGMPAVANVSLGSDFGPHDGTSALERGLAEHVGPGHPGRAVVVAAGNSASLFIETGTSFPEPLGTHTEVHVPRSSSVRVPLIVPESSEKKLRGTVYVWIGTLPGDRLHVGLDDDEGEWVEPVAPGKSASFDRAGVEASIFNGPDAKNTPVNPRTQGAAVILEGSFRTGKALALRLEGTGTARVWVQTEGDLLTRTGGVLVPRATKQGTINVPASSPDLVAVGASVNRTEWSTYNGKKAAQDRFEPDSLPYFTSAGPNAAGAMKPDLVAPGAFLVGAMASTVDPRSVEGGLFDGAASCPDDVQCLVVDREHAVTSGTSMAAPIVAGAFALLFEHDPTLTQPEALALLQGGARAPQGRVPVEQQLGPGALDLVGALDSLAHRTGAPTREPAKAGSWLAASASYVRPDSRYAVTLVAQLRDAEARVAHGFDPDRLRVRVEHGALSEPLTLVAPGLWRFAVSAASGAGGRQVSISLDFDGSPLLERTLPVAVDEWVAVDGVVPRGGCTASRPPRSGPTAWAFLSALLVARRRRSDLRQE